MRFFVWASIAAALLAQAPQLYQGKEEKLPLAVAPQPVLFSHKQHAEARLKCADCHPGAAKAERAGLPDAARCLVCHRTIQAGNAEVRKLAEYEAKGGRIPWVRVYRVPEFVFFSHASHVGAAIECETCHGPVAARDVLEKEVSTSMTSCMNCHAAREVSNDCHFCHALGF
jgi:hypothetical protein